MNDYQKRIAAKIMVALDVPDRTQALALADKLEGIPCYFKVGMELYYAAGAELIHTLKELGHAIFLDLKLHDIPNTVGRASAVIARLGVDMFNVHAAGGVQMMQAALEGVEQAVAAGEAAKRPLVIAVTQLTSTSEAVMNGEIGIPGSLEQSVLRYAVLARQAGLDGVVASAQEAALIKRECGASFVTVTPGIRPAGAALGDQSRVLTPREAFAQGTDYIVIGRPINAAADPRAALEAIINSVE